MDKRIISFFLLLILLCTTNISFAEKTLIYLEHSETLNFDESIAPDCQILVGNVKFRHDSAYMYCDTAYFYNESNLINAKGNIRMEQGDTLFVYGDRLFYDGNTRLARLRNNVRMENKGATLYTDSMNYDRKRNVGYYFVWGKLVDSTNVLNSINGSYYPDYDLAVFQKDVVLTTPDGTLYSDTLRYNTTSGMARIVGPSTIIHDSTTVYSEKGWYDTKRDYSQLLDYSVITDAEGRTLTADTIFYDHKNGYAECRIAATLRDTAENVMVKGDYGFYDEIKKDGYMVHRATFIEHSQKDSLFLTADTLFFASKDGTDVWGNYNVQSFQKDFQSICDSMYYSSKDSIMRLYGTPVCWNEKKQITGDSIYMYSKGEELDKIDVLGNAFVFMEIDSLAFNQVSGKQIRAYVNDGRVDRIDVEGNATSIYFVEEDHDTTGTPEPQINQEKKYVGINRAESSKLVIFVDEENRPRRITMSPASNGTMYTPDKITKRDITILEGFLNCRPIRPKDKFDIYNPKDKSVLRAVSEEKMRFKRKER